ncbi:MAG TPA: TolC family protein [Flavobacteriales bacterium]|nr:TolC family protein [Flavobacteriales bacterium]HRP82261.1 TolC family protein [Flavobacteriales bacterium]
MRTLLTPFLLLGAAFLQAQAPGGMLTAEQAVAIALENNHAVRIAKLDARSVEVANTAGNAGMLPTLSANGSYAMDNSATKQTFFSGEVREADNADSKVLNGALALNWTVFDGFTMFAAKERLEAMEAMGKVELRQQLETTAYNVLTGYYMAVQVKQALAAQRDLIQTSVERLQIAETGARIGTISGVALVQARLDLSADSAAILDLEQQLALSYNRLNTLLGRPSATPVEVAGDIPPAAALDLAVIRQEAITGNAALQRQRQAEQISNLRVNELRGALFPRLDVYGNYAYSNSTSSVGFLQSNTALGPNYGVRISAPIFQGQRNSKAVQVAKIASEQARIGTDQAQLELEQQVLDAWTAYDLANRRVAMGQRDLEGMRSLVDVALESYRLGMLTAVELRDVQQSLLDAENRVLLAQFEAKSAELLLRLLAGKLM